MGNAPACVDYHPGWVREPDLLLGHLTEVIAWEQHDITLFGRTVPTPRLTAWMGDAAYAYSGVVNEPAPWPPALADLRGQLSAEVGTELNSCLANLYRDGTDSMGFHSDDEPELGSEPTIVSISLGARRRFVLRHRVTRERWTWELGEGDLLVMRDESQRDFAHAVPKSKRATGARMSLTFRRFQSRRAANLPRNS